MVLGGQLPGRVDGRRNPISFFMSNLLWWVWRSWLARQIVALEAVGSNPTIHPILSPGGLRGQPGMSVNRDVGV